MEKPKLKLDIGKMVKGDQQLEGTDFITTARATNEVAITTRAGAPKNLQKELMKLDPATLGGRKVCAAWQPGGNHIAIAAVKDNCCLLMLYRKDGKSVVVHNLGAGTPTWLDWESGGDALALMQEGVGLYLWEVGKPQPGQEASGAWVTSLPLKLAPSITVATSFCMWSKLYPHLAIGTDKGKVIIFNKKEGVMQLHDRKGKHGAPVTCGDWLFDNRLGLASGSRVKISQPLAEAGAQWESFSKFKLSGMMSRVPRKFKDAGAPKLLSFSLKYPPFVAVCIGENYMLVFGTAGAHTNEDVGLTFPDDYGPITGFQWLEDDVVLVALANGYVTSVDFGAMVRMRQQHGLPEAVKATGTTKVFNDYLTCLAYSKEPHCRIACVGDKGFKVIVRKGADLEVLVDKSLDYELTLGQCIDSCRWDDKGEKLLITATNGFLWCHEIASGATVPVRA